MNIQDIRQQVEQEIDNKCSEAGQMRLGELLEKLEACNPLLPVVIAGDSSPSLIESYRGFYDHVAIVPGEKIINCEEFAEMVLTAIDGKFEGYKGGTFRMSERTPVWVSEHGEVSCVGVTAVVETLNQVVLEVSLIDC